MVSSLKIDYRYVASNSGYRQIQLTLIRASWPLILGLKSLSSYHAVSSESEECSTIDRIKNGLEMHHVHCMDSINTFPDHLYLTNIKFWGVKGSERRYIWYNFSVFLRKNMKLLRKKRKVNRDWTCVYCFRSNLLWWIKWILNQTFWLPPLDRVERISKNMQWIRDTFTSENENSSDTLPTSRFARKQKKYSRITPVP